MMATQRASRTSSVAFPARPRPKKVSTADAVYDLLRSMILERKLAPGMRLPEVEVAAQLGVSRTPLREAMARLTGDGLIRRVGTSVEVIDMTAELRGIRHIRMALEGYAARLAAEMIDDAELKALESLLQVSSKLPLEALQERVAANTEFHARIFRACGVPQLISAIEGYHEYFIREQELQHLNSDQTRQALAEHREIIAALRARDKDRAEALTRAHLLSTFNQFAGKTSKGKAK